MTLILSGTDGLSDIDGSASTPAIRGTDTNTGIFFPAADTIAFAEGGVESMRLDSSGNLGIGTSSPNSILNVVGGQTTFDTNVFGQVLVRSTAAFNATPRAGVVFSVKYNSAGNYIAGGSSIQGYKQTAVDGEFANGLLFTTQAEGSAPAERARITSSGDLLVGKTVTTETVTGVSISGSSGQLTCSSSSGADAAILYRPTSSGSFGVLLTKSNVGGTNTLVGVGYANGTFGAVSDANKKKNIEDSRSYLADVMQLRVVKYNWVTDEDETPKELGWIAQEVEQVFPGMVSEQEGSKLLKKEVFLPMLMKCIQEQQQMIQTLQAKVAALEAKG